MDEVIPSSPARKPRARRPNVKSESQKELDKAVEQADVFTEQVADLTLNRMNLGRKPESEPQVKKSDRELQAADGIYLKPKKTVASNQKFNERYRAAMEFDKELVKFVAEHKEIIGERIEVWTRPYGGMAAEFWEVPTNKPVYGPRYLAEQLRRKFYNRLTMQEMPTEQVGMGTMYGRMVVDTVVQRLDATPVNTGVSVFMGAK